MFTKEEPMFMSYGIGMEEHDTERCAIIVEFPEYYVVICYTPNSQGGLARPDYRMRWEDDFLVYPKKLEENKPVVFYGDPNMAHKEIDLKNPKTDRENADFIDRERDKFTNPPATGFMGTFRYFYPNLKGTHSWWSYRFSARAKNIKWRIDYFCVSESLKGRLVNASIHNTVMGSDHRPTELVVE